MPCHLPGRPPGAGISPSAFVRLTCFSPCRPPPFTALMACQQVATPMLSLPLPAGSVPIARPSAAALVHIWPVAPANAVSLRSDVSHGVRGRLPAARGPAWCSAMTSSSCAAAMVGARCWEALPVISRARAARRRTRLARPVFVRNRTLRWPHTAARLRSVTVGRARMGRGHPVCCGVAGRVMTIPRGVGRPHAESSQGYPQPVDGSFADRPPGRIVDLAEPREMPCPPPS
jgi:hypothetical protein